MDTDAETANTSFTSEVQLDLQRNAVSTSTNTPPVATPLVRAENFQLQFDMAFPSSWDFLCGPVDLPDHTSGLTEALVGEAHDYRLTTSEPPTVSSAMPQVPASRTSEVPKETPEGLAALQAQMVALVQKIGNIECPTRRDRTRPSYYKDPIAPSAVLSSSESDRGQYHKIKRVLGQRNASEYLVQLVGEPAQQAFWVKKHMMDQKARRGVELKPPPEIP